MLKGRKEPQMEGSFEEKVLGTLKFIESVSTRELAEFIVRQSEAVDGLGKNLDAYVKAFRKMHNQSLNSDGANSRAAG